MRILAIETSCDETAAAIVEDGVKILSNTLATSLELHKKTGGIVPEIAAREQVRCIIPVINEACQVSGIRYQDIDALAVTLGPGLIGSLLVGVETAKTLAYVWGKPIVPVNHLLGHIYASWLNPNPSTLNHKPSFPAVALVASGGHTELVLMKNHGQLKWLGGTRDDAAGEAFDKVARLLGLGYPGGPAIAAEAAKCQISSAKSADQIKLPRPMLNENNFDFSFSGLKTAVLKIIKEEKIINEELRQALAHQFQEAVTDVLVGKTLCAAQKYKVKSILMGGGVCANKRLREKFNSQLSTLNCKLYIPEPKLCTDNAACIASAAFFNYKPVPWQKICSQSALSL